MAEIKATLSCVIVCAANSFDRLRRLAREKVDLDRIYNDVIYTYPGGIETMDIQEHRIGDYFVKAYVIDVNAISFQIVFRIAKDAGRFWKDLMVEVISSVEKAGGHITRIAKL